MLATQPVKDLALSSVMSDLATHCHLLDTTIQGSAELHQKLGAIDALTAGLGDPAVLQALDPTMEGGRKWGEDYNSMAPHLRVGVGQRLRQSYQKELEGSTGMSQEGLGALASTFAGKIAIKAGIIGGTIVTIGVYKRQLIELCSDAIAELAIIGANIKEKQHLFGKKVRATPKQVTKQISLIKGIIAETDKLQKTVIKVGAAQITPDVARTEVHQSINRLVSYGVPMDQTGAAAHLKPELSNPYVAEDAGKADWTPTAVNTFSASISQIESQVKLAHLDATVRGKDAPTLTEDMKVLLLQAQRAVARSAHYALYQLRGLLRIIHNLKFVYAVK